MKRSFWNRCTRLAGLFTLDMRQHPSENRLKCGAKYSSTQGSTFLPKRRAYLPSSLTTQPPSPPVARGFLLCDQPPSPPVVCGLLGGGGKDTGQPCVAPSAGAVVRCSVCWLGGAIAWHYGPVVGHLASDRGLRRSRQPDARLSSACGGPRNHQRHAAHAPGPSGSHPAPVWFVVPYSPASHPPPLWFVVCWEGKPCPSGKKWNPGEKSPLVLSSTTTTSTK